MMNMKYVFEMDGYSQENQLLYKKVQEFKLFEDVGPTNKPLIEILPKLFTDSQIQVLKQESEDSYNFLLKVPGGKGLYDRLFSSN